MEAGNRVTNWPTCDRWPEEAGDRVTSLPTSDRWPVKAGDRVTSLPTCDRWPVEAGDRVTSWPMCERGPLCDWLPLSDWLLLLSTPGDFFALLVPTVQFLSLTKAGFLRTFLVFSPASLCFWLMWRIKALLAPKDSSHRTHVSCPRVWFTVALVTSSGVFSSTGGFRVNIPAVARSLAYFLMIFLCFPPTVVIILASFLAVSSALFAMRYFPRWRA